MPLDLLGGLNKSSVEGDFRLVGEENGGGVGGLLEGAHQIHCLVSSYGTPRQLPLRTPLMLEREQNLVRQYICRDYWDYSQIPSFSGGPKVRRHHVDHCISTLRMVLTCLSDVTPSILDRKDGRVVAVGAPRKCRVYSQLVEWVNSHSVFDSVEYVLGSI